MTITNLKHLSSIKTKLSILLICFFALYSFSQEPTKKNDFWKNVEYGGGLGLNFNNGYFSGSIAPNALYRFSPYIATGVGLNFSYSSLKSQYKSTVLGGSIIGLFNPFEFVQLSTELEQLHVNRKFENYSGSTLKDEYWYPALFLGAGYISNNVTIGIRYDVLYDNEKSIYSEAWMPFVRFRF